eukprot:CAMPEP_0117626084 /NCGR_PEP_ID=MMETSP0802-20121206/1234_1 /TAXON_ID=38833 /ORGANISM="Micromonas sp., Strain CCMP2099" /LENGTH=459 /DNA_ID=CAMNT_0005430185 /DNA_START=206 /DNA_END=1589 /DNA_ORIENTATION=+
MTSRASCHKTGAPSVRSPRVGQAIRRRHYDGDEDDDMTRFRNTEQTDDVSFPVKHYPTPITGAPIELIQPETLKFKAMEPILLLGRERFANLDLRIRVKGGGHVSQMYAVRQAIAKALVAYYQKFVDEQSKKELKDALLTYDRTLLVADPRRMEPKKLVAEVRARGSRSRTAKRYGGGGCLLPEGVCVTRFDINTVADLIFSSTLFLASPQIDKSIHLVSEIPLYDVTSSLPASSSSRTFIPAWRPVAPPARARTAPIPERNRPCRTATSATTVGHLPVGFALRRDELRHPVFRAVVFGVRPAVLGPPPSEPGELGVHHANRSALPLHRPDPALHFRADLEPFRCRIPWRVHLTHEIGVLTHEIGVVPVRRYHRTVQELDPVRAAGQLAVNVCFHNHASLPSVVVRRVHRFGSNRDEHVVAQLEPVRQTRLHWLAPHDGAHVVRPGESVLSPYHIIAEL